MVDWPLEVTMAPHLWEPMRAQGSLSSRIAARIQELISAEELKPGDRLPPERELAGMLGVSRASVREATRSLAAQGRLSIRHGQGIFIEASATTNRLRSSLLADEHDVDELYAMREVLEVPAAQWAAQNVTAKAAATLERSYARLADAIDRRAPWQELQRLDAAFHEAVVRIAGNKFLLRTLGVLNETIAAGMQTTLRIPGRLDQSMADHGEILAAIRTGDSRRAGRASRSHIRGAHKVARREVEAVDNHGGLAR
jgi:GntR family transcriptional repressor for pyruvate dehydrogenase complex